MKRGRGIFITGTDTGVGKTFVSRLIAGELKRRGIDVGVMKPVETGCPVRSGKLVPSDALLLLKASGAQDNLDLVNPYRFSKALAPSVAAQAAGKRISVPHIRASYRKLSLRHDFTLVEGAGGIMVPLTHDYVFLDLAADLGLPILVVSRPGLGTINHTLLTIAAVRERRLDVAGVVINYATAVRKGTAERTNPSIISKLSGVQVIAIVRHGLQRAPDIAAKLIPVALDGVLHKRD